MANRYIPPTVEEDARENKNEQSEKPISDDPESDKKKDKEQIATELPSPENPAKEDDKQKARHQAKEREEKAAKAAQYPRPTPKKPPFYSDAAKNDNSIKFKDAVGRKFRFPYEMAKTWSNMEDLIKQAFIHVDVVGPHVQQGHYDLIGPEGDIILPATWGHFVQPGWAVEMRMWPMDRLAEARPGGRPSMPQPNIPAPPGFQYPPNYPRNPYGSGLRPPPGGLPGGVGAATPNMERRNKAQGTMLSWMAGGGKPPMKKSKEEKASEISQNLFFGGLPKAGRSEISEQRPSSPPRFSDLAVVPLPRGVPRRSTLATEMVPDQSGPRHNNRSLNLRSQLKKGINTLKRSGSPSPSSSSNDTSSDGSSTKSDRSISTYASISSVNTEACRRLISERALVVTCSVSNRPLRRPTTSLNAVKTIHIPPEVLELSAARIYRDGFEKMNFTALELVKRKASRRPPSKESSQAGASTMTWKHVKRPVMSLLEFEDIARYDFGADNATRSAVEQLFASMRKKKLDDLWYIKPGTVIRCDTRPDEKCAASVTFISVPCLYADSFKSAFKEYQGQENCLPRRLHEALTQLGSAEQDKAQYFYQNEGRANSQALWVGQVWLLLGASNLLTYGTVSRETLEGDNVTIRDQNLNEEKSDRMIQITDDDRRLFYVPVDKCKSFYELETNVRDKMSRPDHDLNHCELSFYLPNGEVLSASRWSSLMKVEEVPCLKVSLNFYSSDESDASNSVVSSRGTRSPSSSISVISESTKNKSDISLDLDGSNRRAKSSEVPRVPGWPSSGGKFLNFALVENVTPDIPDDAPQLNRKVPPFFDWRAKNGIETVGEVNDRFREGLDFVETELLQLYKYQQSRTGHMVQQVYDVFGSKIYEEAVQGSFGDFSHRRRSQATEFGPAAVPNARRGEQTALVEKLFRVSIPALEAFVPSELRSSLTSKYFGALAKIMADPTSSELLSKSDDDIEPHDSIHTEDESKQKWVVSRGMIKQTDLRFILDTSTDQTRCPDCERGVIYSNPENGVLHLRKMHRVGAKTDRVLRDYLVTLPAALRERLDEELCGLLNAGHNILASILRKMAAIQSGVMYKDEFRGSDRGIPYSLVGAFKLIVLFVCAVPEALHEIRWFYRDFDYTKKTRDLLSPKVEAQKKVLERLGEVTGELIRKAERALVSPTNSAQEGDPENFMTSVGLHYLSLQILFNLLRRPVQNRKRASDLYAAYAKNLGSEISRKPNKRQILQIGSLSNELNLLKDVVELQQEALISFSLMISPRTLHPKLAKELDRDKLIKIEADLLFEINRAVEQENEQLDGILELCRKLKGLVSELTEIMTDDQGRAVFVFTVVTVTFLPLSFVASYISMSGGTDGIGLEWGDVQARFWMAAAPLTVAVAVFCFFIAGKGTIARLLSAPAKQPATNDDGGGSERSMPKRRGRMSWRPRWSGWRPGIGKRRGYSSSDSSRSSSDGLRDD